MHDTRVVQNKTGSEGPDGRHSAHGCPLAIFCICCLIYRTEFDSCRGSIGKNLEWDLIVKFKFWATPVGYLVDCCRVVCAYVLREFSDSHDKNLQLSAIVDTKTSAFDNISGILWLKTLLSVFSSPRSQSLSC